MEHNPQQSKHRSGIVAIIGPPNSGKSTLLNCFLGQKLSIVTPKPQTTRNRISGILSTEEAQVIFLDTPGIHHTYQALNRHLVDTAWKTLSSADLILLVLDANRYLNKEYKFDHEIALIKNPLQRISIPLLIAVNKVDLVPDKRNLLPLLQKLAQIWPHAHIFPLSAEYGLETQPLLQNVIKALPFAPPLYPKEQLSTLPMKFIGAEIIREKLFLVLNQEIPYSTAVDIDIWNEEPNRSLIYIHATIYIAKQSHKKIVIGNKGTRLKEIGGKARMEIMEILECKIHLDLWVKVKPKWNENIRFFKELLNN